MSSSCPPSVSSTPQRFPLAHLRIIAANKHEKRRCHVRLAVSHRLYWMLVDNDKAPVPTSLYDFKDQSSLAFERLPSTATWEDVTKKVAPYGADVLSFMVPGRLHGRARWKTLSGEVSVILTASTKAERNRWMNEIRLRISPPQVLQERAKALVDNYGAGVASVHVLTEEMKSLFIGDVTGQRVNDLQEVPSEFVDQVSSSTSHRRKRLKRIHDAVPKVDWIENVNAQLASWMGIVASAVKKGAAASEMVSNTAQDVADCAKFVPGGVSAVFQLVALSARLVVMYAEADRGCRELPDVLAKVMNLLDCVAGSVAPILNPTATLIEAEKILEGNVFEVLVTTFDLNGKIEDQLMRCKWSRFLNSAVVKEIESELVTLKQMVVSVALTKQMKGIESGVVANKKGLDEVREKIDGLDSKPAGFLSTGLLPRPKPSPFFVGRRNELHLLKNALEERGSAAITGLGGVGKTQLMATFADETERNGDVPGGVFWITADGKAEDIIESLATFAEKMHGQKMQSEDRGNREVVVETIRKGLSEIEGRWLLCVDNVDYAGQHDVNVILSALTTMAQGDGWVIVTSRTGSPKLWIRMKQGQNVVLNPLSTEDAMRVLLRLKESIDTDEENDEVIGNKLRQLESQNKIEFEALRELADCLSGLPLALAQAAAHISSQGRSFSEYLQLYRAANKKSEFDFILSRTEDELAPVWEEQRSVFTTWKISVERLSKEAVSVLHAVALFGSAPIPGELLKEVLNEVGEEDESPEIRYSRVVRNELVCGSSLLERYRDEGEESFDIHRLVRLFVVVSMNEDSTQTWDIKLSRLIRATHSYVGTVLLQAGKDFYDEPNGHEDRQLSLLPHTRSMMHHREKRGCIILERESVELYHFTGICLLWNGRFSEAEAAYEALLKMKYAIHGREIPNVSIAITLNKLGIVYQRQGKLEQAEKMYDKSLEMKLAIYGSDRPHPNVASTYHNLAAVYQLQGKLEQAEKMYDKSLEMKLAIYGSDRPQYDVASSYYQLGIVYQHQGKLEQAEKMCDMSLEMKLSIYGSDRPHPHVASSYHQLGIVYQLQGKLEQAEKMCDKSMEMDLAIYGSDRPHQSVASSYWQLGMVYQLQGKLEQAEDMIRKSLEMYLAFYGSETPHPSIACTLNGLGVILERQGHRELAMVMYLRALEMYRNVFGSDSDHADLVRVMDNIRRIESEGDTSGTASR